MNLIQCVKSNNFDAVTRLLQNGADVNAVDENGRHALWWAAATGHVECGTALLAAKADVNKVNSYSYTPLHMASAHGRVECVRVRRLCGV